MRKLILTALVAAFAVPVFAGVPSYTDRSEIDAAYKWDLEDIYADNDLWEKDFGRLERMIPGLEDFRGRLGNSGTMLLGALEIRDRVQQLHDRLYVYASMRFDEDTRKEAYAAMRDRISALGVKLEEATAYLSPEILAIPEADLWSLVESTEGLELYRHYLEDLLRGRAHVLDESGEGIMALSGDVTSQFERTFGSFHNADVSYGSILDESGQPVELTKGLYRVFQESPNRRVREDSWKAFYRAYSEFGRTLASNMSGNVKSRVFNAKARGYASSLEASLHPNAIPTQVYRNLITTVRENIAPLHRYADLRKRVLGVDTLRVWDMSAPLVDRVEKEYSWEEGVSIISEGLSVLGEEYMAPFREGLSSGWADVYETPGKRSGAYSWGSYDTKPYLLMNYRGTLDNVFTLAHEMGHSMQTWFSNREQPYVYSDYSTFVAEVASTANEAILIEKMLSETSDSKERLMLLNHYLEQIRGTFFTQVMFADIELQMHERVEAGLPLTKSALDKIYNDTYQVYFGSVLNIDPLNGAAWSRIPHFYYNFYMYQYATSYAAATALAKSIMTQGDPAVARLMDFLKAGNSDYPIEVLKKAGVDMTSQQPILDTIAVFEDLIERFEAELAVNSLEDGQQIAK